MMTHFSHPQLSVLFLKIALKEMVKFKALDHVKGTLTTRELVTQQASGRRIAVCCVVMLCYAMLQVLC